MLGAGEKCTKYGRPILIKVTAITMATIPDFNKNEIRIIHDTVKQRYGKEIEIREVKTELNLPHSTELTPCPAVYRKAGDDTLLSLRLEKAAIEAGFSIASTSSSALVLKSITI